MNIIVFGGTGLIGQAFCRYALMNNHVPIIVSRNPGRYNTPYKIISYTDAGNPVIQRMLSDEYAVVNLTGAGIANKRWSKQRMCGASWSALACAKAFSASCTTHQDSSG
ncbi:MAG: NAD-dependent epimerase/dehydratase family protein, partial [Salinivirgaceae bacterium]